MQAKKPLISHFTEEHELFRQSFRTFLEKEVRPYINEWEENQQIPRSVWKKMGAMGFLGLSYPEQYGGTNLDFFYDVVFNEEIGRMNSGGFAAAFQVAQYMSATYVLNYGSEYLKQKYLPGVVSGDLISAVGITEPGAGSDVQNMQTKAIRQDDFYIVNGAKTFITNGVYGDFIITAVKTPVGDQDKISLLVINLSSKGISKNKLKKLGWHSSDTAELHFDNVKVPAKHLIGEEGKGFEYLMNGLQLERLVAVPGAVTSMEYAIEQVLQYMSERLAFGRSLNKFQVLRHRLAQLASEIEALKAFTYHACHLYNENIYDVKLCSMAKLLATELHEKVASQCLQFYGGYGFMEEYPLARMYRDCRAGTIVAGTSEIMREIIAKIVVDGLNYTGTTGDAKAKKCSPFTEEHDLFRQSLKDFLNKEVQPFIDQWERDGEVPREIYRKFGEMGYFGLAFPEEYEGIDSDIWYMVILHEELSKLNSGGFAAAMGAHFYLALVHINGAGNHEQKCKYLIPGIKGKTVGCMAITEPFGGSDVKAIRTTAVRDGDEYIINGSKTFITNGVLSDYIVAAVKTDPEQGTNGISMMLIERDRKGVSATKLDKLGWRASDTGEIAFDEVRVPATNLLGVENNGFYYIMEHFVSERLSLAVGSVAAAEHALKITLKYMSEREAFGRPINRFQVLRHRIAQMATEIEMNRQFMYHLYARFEAGEYLVKEASMAKLIATQLSDKVTFECLQMFGGYGYMEDYPLARMWRDSRLGQIGGGTSEILCEIIAKMMIEMKGYKTERVGKG